jgi:hypothetical protein
VFVIKSIVPDMPVSRVFAGVVPFIAAESALGLDFRVSRDRPLASRHEALCRTAPSCGRSRASCRCAAISW